MEFGKYELLSRLRVGGMAEVWRAREASQPERVIAIKRILPSFTDEADYVAMFIDEARLSLRLSHPNIVRALELGQIEDQPYIALELVEGQDLGALLRVARERQEPLPAALACRIAIEVCSALHHAHELCDEHGAPLGIVHRDVSPQNVLVSYEGDVKLLDFGIAKSSEQLMRTQAGLLKGKHGYLSPEQAQGQPVDRRSDLFSLGVCLYELLSARRLFQGSSDFSTIVRVRKGEVPALEGVNRDVPGELATIVHRALARERGARFQSALELQRALIAFVEQRAISCDRDALAHWLGARFRRDAAPAADAPEGDEGTGLLAAFEAVEPPSAVSALSDLPLAGDAGGSERLDLGDPAVREGWNDDEAHADAPEPLREYERPAVITPLVPPAPAALDDDEPVTYRAPLHNESPTRVVSYESTQNGQITARASEPTRIDRRTPQAGAVARASAPAGNGAEPRAAAATPVELNAIALDWNDEELSTQIYDPPAGEEGVVGASPPREEPRRPEQTRRTRPTPTPTPLPRASTSFALAPTPEVMPSSAAAPHMMSSAPPLHAGAPVLTDALPGLTAARVSSPPLGDARPSVPTPRGSLSPFGPAARSSVPAARVSMPPPGALHGPGGVLHPDLRVSMPPMGSNRASVAPLRSLPPVDRGPSRAALGWAAAAAAIIVAAVVVALSWFGRPAPAILHVTTDPADAVVTVDGVAVPGTSSPFVATDLAPDVDHDVEVSRAGYHSWRTRLRLRAGRVLALPPVSLQRESGTSTRTLGSAQLPVQAVMPKPAPAPQSLAPSAPTAEAHAPAPAPATHPASHPRRAAPRARERVSPAPAQRTPAPPVKPAPAPAQVAKTTAAGATGDDEKGTLRVNSRPWSRVYIDGRLVGNTPQMQLSLAPGWHTVTLVNPDFGLQKVVTIRIKAGELVTKIIDLSVK